MRVPGEGKRNSSERPKRAGVYAAIGVALVAAGWTALAKEHVKRDWLMTGHDVENSRSQPDSAGVTQGNVARLRPKWVLTTAGDVSATPAVGGDGHDNGINKPKAVYFPDWGGRLWKVDGDTGLVLWVRLIADYNGIPNSLSRTSPVLHEGMLFVGDLNGNMMGIDADTGDLRWKTRLDPNPNTIVTTSPIVFDGRLYISTSSAGGGLARQIFRGSMLALDPDTGKVLWQSFVLPDNGGLPGGFAGGAFVNPPVVDEENGIVIGASGQLYTQPASVTSCLTSAPGSWSESCFPANARFNSVIAFDLRTGAPRWSFRGSGPDARALACGHLPPTVTWCPAAANFSSPSALANFSVWDFAGSGANVFTARIGERQRRVAGIGQKSGVYWALDAGTGELLWSTLVGPGSDPGGIQWGTAYDGARIYAAIGHNTGQAYMLPSGQVITGGSWAALDPSTGRIVWQTADPQGAPDLAALTVANDVLYGGSMAHTGDQMYALDARTGTIRWHYPAGGSVVAGPAVVTGTVYWGSGYARTGGVGNDKFYAFTIDGR